MLYYKILKTTPLIIAVLLPAFSARCMPATEKTDSLKVKNAVYASYGGGGIFFSAIYERQIIASKPYSLGIKGGVGSSFSSSIFPDEFNLPLGVFFLYGERKGYLDLSLSLTTYILEQYDYQKNESHKELRLVYIPSISYRYQKREGGFVARAGFSPILNFNSVTNSFAPWIDISIGWAF